MSTSVPPRDDNAPQSLSALPTLVLGDEEALKRAFLSEYPVLSAEARAGLGDDAVALVPKVVEGAFVRAWDARTKLSTREELLAFLVDDVHHASARALSRRAAAHRFGGAAAHVASHVTSGEVNPDESWAHIQHALHGEEHSPGALAAVAAASRHEAAGHIGSVGKAQSVWAALALGGIAVAAVDGALGIEHAREDLALHVHGFLGHAVVGQVVGHLFQITKSLSHQIAKSPGVGVRMTRGALSD